MWNLKAYLKRELIIIRIFENIIRYVDYNTGCPFRRNTQWTTPLYNVCGVRQMNIFFRNWLTVKMQCFGFFSSKMFQLAVIRHFVKQSRLLNVDFFIRTVRWKIKFNLSLSESFYFNPGVNYTIWWYYFYFSRNVSRIHRRQQLTRSSWRKFETLGMRNRHKQMSAALF